MEFGDIVRIVDRVSGGGGESRGPIPLTDEQQRDLDQAGKKFYKGIHGIMHGLGVPARPQDLKKDENPHIVKAYTTAVDGIVIDINPYKNNCDQTVGVIIRNLRDYSVEEIEMKIPKSRSGLTITINKKQATPEDLDKAMEKMSPSLEPETKKAIVQEAKTRAHRKTGVPTKPRA